MDTDLQLRTIQALDGLPPLHIFNCQTVDQAKHWIEIREAFVWLKQAFKDYFSGKPSNHSQLSPRQQEFYGLLRDFYLTWYQCIQWGWNDIKQSVAEQGLDIESYASTPGEALIRLLEDSASALMEPAFTGYHRWTPSQTRDLAKRDREIGCLLSGENISDVEKLKIKKYQRDIKVARIPYEKYFNFYENSLRVCERAKKGSRLKEALVTHKKTRAQLDAVIQSSVHKRHRLKGYEWRNGEKKYLGKYGGI
ncbi:hypothetical protein BLD44_007665 [Mastigocladus laminosus UU774]|nr:hypothetical protein BLD44_007665 [Mastigocladus laminosus UU774]